MSAKTRLSSFIQHPYLIAGFMIAGLSACGSSSDGVGYVQFYNASSNAPAIYLTMDKDNDDDFNSKTHSAVSYGKAGGSYEYDTDNYDIDLSWDDGDSELEEIYESSLIITDDDTQLVVIAGNIASPEVLYFDIEYIDDDNDDDEDLFNLRIINMHSFSGGVDIYLSKSNETFNEAVLFSSVTYSEISANVKYDQDDYIIYLTAAGSMDVLYQSEEIAYIYPSQYLMIIRENNGPSDSPFTLDQITKSSGATEYPDADASAEFRLYNGLIEHELLPEYHGVSDVHVNGIDDDPEVQNLHSGEFSESMQRDFGDYSLDLTIPETNEVIIQNHLLTLNAGDDKTVFFYIREEDVSDDDDEEEIEITLNSLVVDNSNRESLYDHQVTIINLIDDFSKVDVYFVESNETIDSTDNDKHVPYIAPQSITLLNNTYSVYVIGEENSTDMILVRSELMLDEDTHDMFLIIEEDVNSSTGYKMIFTDQKD
ncbi:MAG: hypothetical protein MJK12_03675 [Colwellia sp.]|nr:hypothetical protein [Colwellia sp.]